GGGCEGGRRPLTGRPHHRCANREASTTIGGSTHRAKAATRPASPRPPRLHRPMWGSNPRPPD
ncbi:hypothetical protein ACTXT7_003027, partial [Hymenolepis weldensis]